MKIQNTGMFLMSCLFLQANLAFSMQSRESQKKNSEQLEYGEKSPSPMISGLMRYIAEDYFRQNNSNFESIVVQINSHDETNRFSVIALDGSNPGKDYSRNIKPPAYPEATQIVSIPFANLAKHMNLRGAHATHLKVYKDKDKVFFAVGTAKYNKDAVFAVITINDNTPKKANL